jgi:hypothetical protein
MRDQTRSLSLLVRGRCTNILGFPACLAIAAPSIPSPGVLQDRATPAIKLWIFLFVFSGFFPGFSWEVSEMDGLLWSQLWRIHRSLENVILHRDNKNDTLVERERGIQHFGWQLFLFPSSFLCFFFFYQSDHARLLNSTREGTSGAEAATPATHIEEEANSTNPAATVSCLEVGLQVVRKLRVCRGFTSTISRCPSREGRGPRERSRFCTKHHGLQELSQREVLLSGLAGRRIGSAAYRPQAREELALEEFMNCLPSTHDRSGMPAG